MRFLPIFIILVTSEMLFPLWLSAAEVAEVDWSKDFQGSRELALEKGLPLLLWFTGSDWCLWCQKLESELFAEKAFRNAAGTHFIPVKVDFPRRNRLTLVVERQNRLLQQRFRVEAFPTVILLCPETGKELYRHGYLSISGRTYVQNMRFICP